MTRKELEKHLENIGCDFVSIRREDRISFENEVDWIVTTTGGLLYVLEN